MNQVRKTPYLLILLCLCCLTSLVQAAEITAAVGAPRVYQNESFQLTLTVSGSPEADPDLTPLEQNFRILQRSQSSSLTIINGNLTSTRVWRLMLMAKRAGDLEIPSIAFGSDKSNRIRLQVLKADRQASGGADSEMFIEVEVDDESPYVQQQVLYTVRVFRAVNINNASLNNPQIEGGEALIEKSGEDRNNEVWRNNKRYQVTERRFLIFPQSSGELTIQPVQLEAQLLAGRRGSVFDFDRFSNPGSNRVVRIESKPIILKVKPVPAEFNGEVWLPAKSLRLDEDWSHDPNQLSSGEPVTRSIRMSVEGLSAVQLPPIEQDLPEGLKSYPDQPVFEQTPIGKTTMSNRIEKTAIIPSRPGDYTLPAVRVAWWNTETNQQEIAELPARHLSVAAAANTQPTSASSIALTEAASTARSAPAPSDASKPQNLESKQQQEVAPGWLYASLVFLGGAWLITLFAWWRLYRRSRVVAQTDNASPNSASLTAIQRRMSLACVQNDASRVKDCLLEWAALMWPDESILHLSALVSRVDDDFAKDIVELQETLYSQHRPAWNGQGFFERFKQQQVSRAGKAKAPETELEPLYRIA